MSRVVGIVGNASLFETDDLYQDRYSFVNHYMLRVQKNGGIPIGLLPVDGHLSEDSLALCDAILICGGGRIYPYHMEAAAYAIAHEKKLLGICLGMQVIHSWLITVEKARERGFQGDLLAFYNQLKKERFMFTEPVAHHWDDHPTRDRIEGAKHPVLIEPDSLLARVLGRTDTLGASMHRYRIGEPGSLYRIVARSMEGSPEGLEYGENVLGVQFHPEIDDVHAALFRFLIS